MAKQGMKRPEIPNHPKNAGGYVPQLQGQVKTGKEKAPPIIPGTMGAELKVYHEPPISKAYRALDSDLAVDNLLNDLPLADLQDLQ